VIQERTKFVIDKIMTDKDYLPDTY